MDPTESIKNLTFSLSVLGAAPVLKADVLAKGKKKKKEGERGKANALRYEIYLQNRKDITL